VGGVFCTSVAEKIAAGARKEANTRCQPEDR
jgi:hypothetical protein